MVKFSIIIPVFNAELTFDRCLNSVLDQKGKEFSYEVLLVDDCSTDQTAQLLNKYRNRTPSLVKTFKTERNAGPGLARNIGLENAKGNWILFLDSDDRLNTDALEMLSHYILKRESNLPDIVGFNWQYAPESSVNNGRSGGRYDFKSLLKEKSERLKDFISLGMDGSVIYTVIRNNLLQNNNIRFYGGIHEDVNFIFKVYWHSGQVGCIEKPLYLKNNRENSIVNSISLDHIKGYFRAYKQILKFFLDKGDSIKEYGSAYYTGLIGVVATRAREISKHNLSDDASNGLYLSLYHHWVEISRLLHGIPIPELKTKYGLIAKQFIAIMENTKNNTELPAALIKKTMEDIELKSWSCYDLHHSIFLAPDEVRTCCKRFFVDGKMKGDVTIVRATKTDSSSISADTILKGKKDLYTDINRGTCDACEGCPFLEFKDWGYIEELNIEHLSLEYHSVCNMKCTYCSETYYGGASADYDVEGLIIALLDRGRLKNCRSVVWGGGEPALGEKFEEISALISSNFPNIKQRVLTNCLKYSEPVNQLLLKNKASLLTSIDAGTQETFSLVRGSTQFNRVFKNLKKYAISNIKNVSIKYIFTEDNSRHHELKSFVNLVAKHKLLDCSFQISSDFRQETIDVPSAVSMIMLYKLLMKTGCRLVYFDELLRQRFFNGPENTLELVKNELVLLGLDEALADHNQFETVVIWGAGFQTQLLVEHSHFFRAVKIAHLVDSTPSKIGTKFMGYAVRAPETLKEYNGPVLISAVQNSPLIYEKYIKLGLDDSRLVKGLIL